MFAPFSTVKTPRTPTNSPRMSTPTNTLRMSSTSPPVETIDTSSIRRDLHTMYVVSRSRRPLTPLYVTPTGTKKPIHKRVAALRRQQTFRRKKRAVSNIGSTTLCVPIGKKLGKKMKRVQNSPRALFLLERAWRRRGNRDKFIRVESKKKSSDGIKRDTPKVKPCGAAPSPSVEPSAKSE